MRLRQQERSQHDNLSKRPRGVSGKWEKMICVKKGTWVTDPETGNRICQAIDDIYFGEDGWGDKYGNWTPWYVLNYGIPELGTQIHWIDSGGPYWRLHTEDNGWMEMIDGI